tara:strand:- start:1161 stop:1439 length:279 start_codon:yes stop_codon:yes gene_type:complete
MPSHYDQEQLMQMLMIMNPEMAQMMQLLNGMNKDQEADQTNRRRKSAYQRRYKAAFKKIQSRYKLKSGRWKKGGFRAAVREAHKMARRGGKK